MPSFTFQDHALVKPSSSGVSPEAIETADLNRDGNPDTVVGTLAGVQTLLGNGDGTFQAAVLHQVPSGAMRSVVTADFDADGHVDIAASQQVFGQAPKVTLLSGNGDGTFAPPVNVEVGSAVAGAWATASPFTADVNGDGSADLVVGIERVGSTVQYETAVLVGRGDGTFATPRAADTAGGVILRELADVNGDGRADLLGTKSGQAAVAHGDGQGGFGTVRTIAAGADPLDVTAGDLNGDGRVDLVTISRHYDVNVLLATKKGSYSAPTTYRDTLLRAFRGTLVDLNSDGHLDVAVANTWNDDFPGTGRVAVFLGSGDGTLQDVRRYLPVVNSPFTFDIAPDDFDGDGRPDLIVSNNKNLNSVTSLHNTTQ
ncbi:FG-GAP repeat domain-containing protein [Streptomyces dysideae]|uniref:FG-GAP repeat domain-containing protein n=1 Tax=Streptomyces dysideae TaxID=909626 RepID=UPI00082BDA0E|nr:VCBS repeat-containing protein [Streptomyces dysideae]